jgi:hypothetical protein
LVEYLSFSIQLKEYIILKGERNKSPRVAIKAFFCLFAPKKTIQDSCVDAAYLLMFVIKKKGGTILCMKKIYKQKSFLKCLEPINIVNTPNMFFQRPALIFLKK